MVIRNLISQPQGDRDKKKEAMHIRNFLTGNTNSYSIILNDEKSLGKFQDYNDLSVGLAMLNTEKDVKVKEAAAKKVLEAAYKARKKSDKDK